MNQKKEGEKGKFFELIVPTKTSTWKEDDITAALLVPAVLAPEEEEQKRSLNCTHTYYRSTESSEDGIRQTQDRPAHHLHGW